MEKSGLVVRAAAVVLTLALVLSCDLLPNRDPHEGHDHEHDHAHGGDSFIYEAVLTQIDDGSVVLQVSFGDHTEVLAQGSLYDLVYREFDEGFLRLDDEFVIESTENELLTSRDCFSEGHFYERTGSWEYMYQHLHAAGQVGLPDSYGYVDCDVTRAPFQCKYCGAGIYLWDHTPA